VNLLVDHADTEAAPIVYEDHPTLANLLGRVEYVARMGNLTTDFTLIKAGALHRANGGYLLLDAEKLLRQPFAYDGLKRALACGHLRIESPAQAMGLLSTVTLEPEPMPLEVKVVLVGSRLVYYLLSAYDPEFGELFKIAADFDNRADRSADNEALWARLVASMVKSHELAAFDAGAVARLIEECARELGDSEKLSTRTAGLDDLMREADHYAHENGRQVVRAADVERAVAARVARADRAEQRLREEILRGTVFIDTEGAKSGQINGLAVLSLGDHMFGRPSRITSRVRMGKGEVVDIEREVKLAGPIHSKGVLILSTFLAARYAADRPLSLSASLVFEQSYGGIDGDSASVAELTCLLSAIADVPIRQGVAVTGSVNQHGEVQPIGGVNQKIEGFFKVCEGRGLSGYQGVVIPRSNVKHLMLRQDVVSAVAAGRFHVWAVSRVDEALELLTGVAAGERGDDGAYPEGSFNRRVEDRLAELAEKRRKLAPGRNNDKDDGGDKDEDDDGGEPTPRPPDPTPPPQPPPGPPAPPADDPQEDEREEEEEEEEGDDEAEDREGDRETT
jgi:lon-related putative ATP-dependent protease